METKAEFRKRENDWLEALDGSPSNQKARILENFNEERVAWGLKPIHQ